MTDALRQQLEQLERSRALMTGAVAEESSDAAPALPWWGQGEELYILEENQSAVTIWLLIEDQWIRAGVDGVPVAFDMTTAMIYVKAYCDEAARLGCKTNLFDVLMGIKFIASEVLPVIQERSKPRGWR